MNFHKYGKAICFKDIVVKAPDFIIDIWSKWRDETIETWIEFLLNWFPKYQYSANYRTV
jgi:hypothetical protein